MPALRYRAAWEGEGFPLWLRELRHTSGLYVIRSLPWLGLIGGGEVLYVGSSWSGRLYGTLTRHFQRWSGPQAGPTYNPRRVEVAARVIAPSPSELRHVALRDIVETQERELIRALRPRDNRQWNEPDELDLLPDAPF